VGDSAGVKNPVSLILTADGGGCTLMNADEETSFN